MRRNGGYAVIRCGILDHLVRGDLSFAELGIYATIHLQADFRTGVWIGSAARLAATAPKGVSLRDVQRALQHFANLRLIRCFRRKGARGNYRAIINKFEPQFGAHKNQRLNADKSMSWQAPVWESCAEGDAEPVAEGVAQPDTYSFSNTHSSVKPLSRVRAKPTPSPAGLALASLLRERILGHSPKAKITDAQFSKWPSIADSMLRLDNRTEPEIRAVIEWCTSDPFWCANVFSMQKVREKFDQLAKKMQEAGKNGKPTRQEIIARSDAAIDAVLGGAPKVAEGVGASVPGPGAWPVN